LLIDNVVKGTVVLPRVVYEVIRSAGMIRNVAISAKMIASVRPVTCCHMQHVTCFAPEAKCMQKTDVKDKTIEERKHKAPISSLEQQKKIKLQEAAAL